MLHFICLLCYSVNMPGVVGCCQDQGQYCLWKIKERWEGKMSDKTVDSFLYHVLKVLHFLCHNLKMLQLEGQLGHDQLLFVYSACFSYCEHVICGQTASFNVHVIQ